MRIEKQFTVSVPAEKAWEVLTDWETVVGCMPGAQLISADGDSCQGKVRVKLGPVTADYSGTASFTEKDDTAHRAVINAKGRDSRGAGTASATITAQLSAEGDTTSVHVDTDLKITGKVAQFGRGLISEVSDRLLGEFVTSLEAKLDASEEAESAPEQGESAQGDSASTQAESKQDEAKEPEALDLMGVAGASIAKRAVPVVIGAIVVVGLIVYFATR
jgi:uncharacterized protein